MLGLGLNLSLCGLASPSPGGGGGEEPAWLEEFILPNATLPLVAAHFKDGNYWANEAEVTAADIFESDPEFGEYNPANIQAGVGLVGVMLTSAPSLKDAVTGGFFASGYMVRGKVGNSTGNMVSIDTFDQPAFEFYFDALVGTTDAYIGDGTEYAICDPGTVANGKFAINVAPTNIAISANGSAVQSLVPGVTPVFNKVNIGVRDGKVLEWIAFYPVQPNADLQIHSA